MRLRLLTNVAALMRMVAVLMAVVVAVLMAVVVAVLTAVEAVVVTKYWFSLNLDTMEPFPGGPGRASLCGSG